MSIFPVRHLGLNNIHEFRTMKQTDPVNLCLTTEVTVLLKDCIGKRRLSANDKYDASHAYVQPIVRFYFPVTM